MVSPTSRFARVVVLAIAVATALSACGSTDDGAADGGTTGSSTEQGSATTATTVPLAPSVPSDYGGFLRQPTACGADAPPPATNMRFDAPADMGIDGAVTATLLTSCGPIEVRLDSDGAPETVNSFAFLAEQGYFDGTVSHRIVPGFMVQMGDPTATGLGGPGYTIPDEYPATADYRRGVVAMANAGPDSAGSQFFILFGDADWLPPQYTIFGEVVGGFDTLDAIEQIPLGRGPASADPSPSTPLETLFIESVAIER